MFILYICIILLPLQLVHRALSHKKIDISVLLQRYFTTV